MEEYNQFFKDKEKIKAMDIYQLDEYISKNEYFIFSDIARFRNIGRSMLHYQLKKSRLFLRDGKKCKICLSDVNMEIHHKDRDRNNNNEENLITLCRNCHRKLHKFKLCDDINVIMDSRRFYVNL